MGKQTPQAPTPPDPVALANAQGAANKDTAITQARLNAVDTVNPYGTVKYTETPGTADGHVTYDENGNAIPVGDATPHFTQTTTLSPEQQALYNSQVGTEQKAYDTANQAIGNVQGVLSSPFTFGDMPPLVTGINGGTPQSGFGTVNPLFGIASGGNIQTGIGDPGAIQNNLTSTGQQTSLGYSNPIQSDLGDMPRWQPTFDQGGPLAGNVSAPGQNTSVGYSNPIQTAFAQGGPLAGNVSPTGQQTGIGSAGPIQGQINTSGLPSTPLTANDFAQQGQATTDALMQRFNQDWSKQQEADISRLNAQGIQQGSEGYGNAMDTLNRARNDASAQAILAGNQVQNNLFNQALASRGQVFGENQAAGQFANQAQGQQFGQNLQAGQFSNDALNSLLQQQLASGQFQNATAGQQFGQNQALAQFGNQAQQQGYGQALSSGQFSNDALNNILQQQLAAGGFQNATAGQQYAQNQGAANFANNAGQQNFNNTVTGANFANNAQQQGYNQALGSGQFTNQALQNLFGQNQAAQGAQNAAQQQLYAQLLGGGNFANAAQAQQFGQNSAQQQAYNQAAQQQTGNNQALASFYNTAQGQAFSQAQANAALQNQARQQSIAEQQLLRSQPINEIATLLGLGSGIQVPQAAPNFGIGVAPTDVLGAYGLNQQAQQNNYNAQLQANNALWGGLGNLAGSLGGAAILASDRRVKNIIRRIGQTATGVPLYLYEYKDRPGVPIVGVMAQEVRERDPLAVYENDSGVLLVDYARVA